MRKCWREDPAKRPTFGELASTLASSLQSVSGYMELSMNLPVSEVEPEQEDMETVVQSEGKIALQSFPSTVGYTTLNVSLIGEPMSDDIPVERNPVYGASDGVLVLENPAYSIPSVSLPAAAPQPPTTATDEDEQQQSDGEYEPVDCQCGLDTLL